MSPLAEIKEKDFELSKTKIVSKSRDQAARLKMSFQNNGKRAATSTLEKIKQPTPKFANT